MGCTSSAPDPDPTNPESNKKKKKNVAIMRILILGTAEVGKSTFFKQIRILHANKFTQEELQLYKKILFKNFHAGIINLIDAAKALEIDLTKYEPEVLAFTNASTNETIDMAKLSAAKILWKSDQLQRAFRESNIMLTDSSLPYFLENIEAYAQEDYVLKNEDVVRLRQRTIGTPNLEFPFKNWNVQMVDFGGQEVERRKWPLLAEGAKSLIFLASLTQFQTPSDEEKGKTQLDVSLDVFSQVVQSDAFANCTVILFLNKWDLFQEQIKNHDFAKAFPEYKGNAKNAEECSNFVQDLYMKRLQGSKHTVVSAHLTTAVDTNTMDKVFQAVMSELLRSSLESVGFVL